MIFMTDNKDIFFKKAKLVEKRKALCYNKKEIFNS